MLSASITKKIVNFRVNENIKYRFEDICRTNGSNMTYELTNLMKGYIIEQAKVLQSITSIQTTKTKSENNHIKPSQKTADVDWYGDIPSKAETGAERFGNVVKNQYGVWEEIK
jgi:antitoxin component of RelBE/YafQ-DinJ toxin-antitoxin module